MLVSVWWFGMCGIQDAALSGCAYTELGWEFLGL